MINIVYTKNCLTISSGDNVKTIQSDNKDYKNLVDMYKNENFSGLEDYLNGIKPLVENNYKNSGFTVQENVVFINGEPLPTALSNRIVNHANEKLPIDRFLKFWNKLSQNPSATAVRSLYEFMERNNLPLTEDGDLICWKAVRSDWTDKHTGKIKHEIGVPQIEHRRNVDDDVRKDCSFGRHVGSISYVKNFTSFDDHIIECVVNPKNVVSVPEEGRANKIRVCEFLPFKEVTSFNEYGEHYTVNDENNLTDEDECSKCGDTSINCLCGDEDKDMCLGCDNYLEDCCCEEKCEY